MKAEALEKAESGRWRRGEIERRNSMQVVLDPEAAIAMAVQEGSSIRRIDTALSQAPPIAPAVPAAAPPRKARQASIGGMPVATPLAVATPTREPPRQPHRRRISVTAQGGPKPSRTEVHRTDPGSGSLAEAVAARAATEAAGSALVDPVRSLAGATAVETGGGAADVDAQGCLATD